MTTEKYRQGDCLICEKYFTLLHWHHTTPQSLGGKDSLQIPLCGTCHNILHANADAVVSNQRTGRKISRQFWQTSTQEQNAQPYLEILVDAILNYSVDETKLWKSHLEIPDALYKKLHLLKTDTSGLTSIQSALLYCIADTLRNKGYIDESSDSTKPQSSKRSPKRKKGRKTNLW